MNEPLILEKPDPAVLPDLIRRAIGERNTVIVIGECSVEYEGRSTSRLGKGDRVLMIKQDGSVLVHRPTGYSPVNWQPDTSVIEAWINERGELSILAVRSKPREVLNISFSRVDSVIIARLRDDAEFTMYLDEAEMKRVLVGNPELIEPGFRVVEDEKRLGSGQADIYGVDKEGRPVIVELKRITASRDAVLQLYGYVKAYEATYGKRPRGILIAPSFSPSAIETLLRLQLEYRQVDLRELYRLAVEKGLRRSLLEYGRRPGERERGTGEKTRHE